MDISEIQTAFDDVFDQAIIFHGFADYLRDYDVYLHAVADPSTGIPPAHLRYRFKRCVKAVAESALTPDIWKQSLDDRLVDYEQGQDLDGYVWGVKWQLMYQGLRLVSGSKDAARWSRDLGIPFHEAAMETNGHNVTLVFSDLIVETLPAGHTPFLVS